MDYTQQALPIQALSKQYLVKAGDYLKSNGFTLSLARILLKFKICMCMQY